MNHLTAPSASMGRAPPPPHTHAQPPLRLLLLQEGGGEYGIGEWGPAEVDLVCYEQLPDDAGGSSDNMHAAASDAWSTSPPAGGASADIKEEEVEVRQPSWGEEARHGGWGGSLPSAGSCSCSGALCVSGLTAEVPAGPVLLAIPRRVGVGLSAPSSVPYPRPQLQSFACWRVLATCGVCCWRAGGHRPQPLTPFLPAHMTRLPPLPVAARHSSRWGHWPSCRPSHRPSHRLCLRPSHFRAAHRAWPRTSAARS